MVRRGGGGEEAGGEEGADEAAGAGDENVEGDGVGCGLHGGRECRILWLGLLV